jgi:hypothetical protein
VWMEVEAMLKLYLPSLPQNLPFLAAAYSFCSSSLPMLSAKEADSSLSPLQFLGEIMQCSHGPPPKQAFLPSLLPLCVPGRNTSKASTAAGCSELLVKYFCAQGSPGCWSPPLLPLLQCPKGSYESASSSPLPLCSFCCFPLGFLVLWFIPSSFYLAIDKGSRASQPLPHPEQFPFLEPH